MISIRTVFVFRNLKIALYFYGKLKIFGCKNLINLRSFCNLISRSYLRRSHESKNTIVMTDFL